MRDATDGIHKRQPHDTVTFSEEVAREPRNKPMKTRFFLGFIAVSLVLVLVGGAVWFVAPKFDAKAPWFGLVSDSVYASFTLDVFDIIYENYWDVVEESVLADLYDRAAALIRSEYKTIGATGRRDVRTVVARYLESFSEEEYHSAIIDLNIVVLSALEPNGRSGLYSEERERALRDSVSNVRRDRDLYEILGAPRDASLEDLEALFAVRSSALEEEGTEEARVMLEELSFAHSVLSDESRRERYDIAGVEPTVSGTLIAPTVYYIRIAQFSPQSFEEFVEAAERAPQGEAITSLVLDLRGNVGGAIDFLPYFLGPFIGPGNIAYEFFQKGERTPFRTQVGFIPQLKQFTRRVVLIDERSQSSAEAMASTLATYNAGVLIGERSAGWGTVENTFPIQTQIDESTSYSVFLVHSLTLRPDGRPIESLGVDPHISIASETWERDLLRRFNDQNLVDAVRSLYENN